MSKDKYLGETLVNLEDSPFKDFSASDIAMYFVEKYGGIDGSHHKNWVLDQVARALKNSPIINLRKAQWIDGTVDYRWELGESDEYKAWVLELQGEWDEDEECFEYEYDVGIAP